MKAFPFHKIRRTLSFERIFLFFVIAVALTPPYYLDTFPFVYQTILLATTCIALLLKPGMVSLRTDLIVWLFVLLLFENIHAAQDKTVALHTYCNLTIPLISFYYLFKAAILSRKTLYRSFTTVACAISLILSVWGIIDIVTLYNPLYEHNLIHNPFYDLRLTRLAWPMASLLHAVPLATIVLACLPFLIIRHERLSGYKKHVNLIAIAANIYICTITLSRSIFLGVIAIIGLYSLARKKYSAILALFLGMVILVSTAHLFPHPFSRFSIRKIVGNQQVGLVSNYKLERYRILTKMIKDYPLTGVGCNHFRIRFNEYFPKTFHPYAETEKVADCMYVTLLAETGVLGFGGFVFFILILLYRQLRAYFRTRNTRHKEFLLAGLMAQAGLFCAMTGYELFYWQNPYMFFCIIVAWGMHTAFISPDTIPTN